MASSAGQRRLAKEYRRLAKETHEHRELFQVAVLEDNLFELHFCLLGRAGTPFAGGTYHGRLIFPDDYPLRPPAIYMMTPSGRFQTNQRLCLSISDYHPETWDASLKTEDVLLGLACFMEDLSDEALSAVGSLRSSEAEKRLLAARSRPWNKQQPAFADLFPDLCRNEEPEASSDPTPPPSDASAASGPDPGAGVLEDSFDCVDRGSPNTASQLAQLVDMGFSDTESRIALRWCRDDMALAVELLLTGDFGSPSDQPDQPGAAAAAAGQGATDGNAGSKAGSKAGKAGPNTGPGPSGKDSEVLGAALDDLVLDPVIEELMGTEPGADKDVLSQLLKRLNRLARISRNKAVMSQPEHIRHLVAILTAASAGAVVRLCCRHIVAILLSSVQHRAVVVEAGALPPLLGVLTGPASRAKKYAAQALTEIVCAEDFGRLFCDLGGVEALGKTMLDHAEEDPDTLIYVVWSVEILAQKTTLREQVQGPSFVRAFVAMCRSYVGNARVSLRAAYALVCLSVSLEGAQSVAQAGGIQYIADVTAKHDDNNQILETSCWALSNLAFQSVELKNAIVDADCLLSCRLLLSRLPTSVQGKLALDRLDSPRWIGSSPVWHAARRGRLDEVVALADGGADINRPYTDGKNPLRIADDNAHMDVIIALAERGAALKYFAEPREGHAPLQPQRIALASDALTQLYSLASTPRDLPDRQARRERLVAEARRFGIPPPASEATIARVLSRRREVTPELEELLSRRGVDVAAECFSCLEPLVDVTSSAPIDLVRLEPCGHFLHAPCVEGWLRKSRACCPAPNGLTPCNATLDGAWGPPPPPPPPGLKSNIERVVERLLAEPTALGRTYACRVLLDLLESSPVHRRQVLACRAPEAVVQAMLQFPTDLDMQDVGSAFLCRLVLGDAAQRQTLFAVGAVPVLSRAMALAEAGKYAAHCLTEMACDPLCAARLVQDGALDAALDGAQASVRLADAALATFSLWLLELLAVQPDSTPVLTGRHAGRAVLATLQAFASVDVQRRAALALVNLSTLGGVGADFLAQGGLAVLVAVADRPDATPELRACTCWSLSNLAHCAPGGFAGFAAAMQSCGVTVARLGAWDCAPSAGTYVAHLRSILQGRAR